MRCRAGPGTVEPGRAGKVGQDSAEAVQSSEGRGTGGPPSSAGGEGEGLRQPPGGVAGAQEAA